MKSRPPGERGGIELKDAPTLEGLDKVLLAYLEASRHGAGEIEVFDPEGKAIGVLLPPTAERQHASIRLVEGNRIIPLAMERAVREARYDPKNYRVKAPDAARITEIVAEVVDRRDRERSAASLRSRAEAQAERARDPLVELREVFGERLKGIVAVLKTFTIRDGKLDRPLRTFSDGEKQEIADSLRAKLKTPEATALMRVLKKDSQEAARWLCVLRIAKLDRGAPLTLVGLQLVLERDMRKRGQGNLADLERDFTNEPFYVKEEMQHSFDDPGMAFDWAFVRYQTIPGTNGIAIDQQERVVANFLTGKGFEDLGSAIRRRRPVEAIYDYALTIRTSDVPSKDPLFRTPIREAIEIDDPEFCLVVGPYNPHTSAGVEVELEDRHEIQGEVGAVISF